MGIKVSKIGYQERVNVIKNENEEILVDSNSIRASRIDGVECSLFSNYAPLGQTTLRVGNVSV